MGTYRHYSDEDRARILAVYESNGRNLSQTERETGVPRSTIRRWVADPDRAAPAELRQEKAGELDAVMEDLVWRMLAIAKVTLTTIQDGGDVLPVGDMTRMMTALGILVDKMRLLRDQSTSHVTFESLVRAVEEDGFTVDEWIAEVNRIAAGDDSNG